MNTLRILLLALAIMATMYQVVKLTQLIIMMDRFVTFRIKKSFWFAMTSTVAIQVACVYSFIS